LTPLSKAIGRRLRELRLDAEISQAELGRRAGIHRPIVGRLERGLHVHDLDSLQRYARALDIDLLTVLAPVDIDGLVSIDGRFAHV
jgi:transcriptional regulator with XRE-family HTH domain